MTPLALSLPRSLAPSLPRPVDTLINVWDLMPTLLALAGIPCPSTVQGRDLSGEGPEARLGVGDRLAADAGGEGGRDPVGEPPAERHRDNAHRHHDAAVDHRRLRDEDASRT